MFPAYVLFDCLLFLSLKYISSVSTPLCLTATSIVGLYTCAVAGQRSDHILCNVSVPCRRCFSLLHNVAGVIFPVLDLVFRSPFICYLYIFFSRCLILVCDVPYVQSPGIMAGYMLGSISAAKCCKASCIRCPLFAWSDFFTAFSLTV